MKGSTYDIMKKIIILIGIIAAILAILIPLRAKSQLLSSGRSFSIVVGILQPVRGNNNLSVEC
jgi:hypothetical protein